MFFAILNLELIDSKTASVDLLPNNSAGSELSSPEHSFHICKINVYITIYLIYIKQKLRDKYGKDYKFFRKRPVSNAKKLLHGKQNNKNTLRLNPRLIKDH